MIHFRSNMTRAEFLDWLRYSAIAGNMPEQFIDQVDTLEACIGTEDETLELRGQLADAEEELAAVKGALEAAKFDGP